MIIHECRLFIHQLFEIWLFIILVIRMSIIQTLNIRNFDY